MIDLIKMAEKLDYRVESIDRDEVVLKPIHLPGPSNWTITINRPGLQARDLEWVLADAGRFYHAQAERFDAKMKAERNGDK